MKAVVVGAGLSGLAAAYRLQQAGVEVELFEATGLPGGRCGVFRQHGFLVDMCPEISAASYERFFALAHGAGLGGDIVKCSPVVSTMRNGSHKESQANQASQCLQARLSRGHSQQGLRSAGADD